MSARVAPAGAALLLVGFLAVGLVGVRRYGENYWNYRGFAAPRDPAYVHTAGVQESFDLPSPALGGRAQPVDVYLPPNYDPSGATRYPVLYLLHGFPGRPLAFLETVRMGVVEDELVAQQRAQPFILVMPFGSTGTFTDEEWVDGAGPNDGWQTFVTRDLVNAIDARYPTIASRDGRAVAGLSEGGYGAIDMALRHPNEFSMVESWSGYERPDKLRSIFGPKLQLVARNDPRLLVGKVTPALRQGLFVWFYSGRDDPLRHQNEAFAAELTRDGVPHRYFEAAGGHNWALWRAEAVPAFLAASEHVGD
jgi:enterochelin esterase-like enzyme